MLKSTIFRLFHFIPEKSVFVINSKTTSISMNIDFTVAAYSYLLDHWTQTKSTGLIHRFGCEMRCQRKRPLHQRNLIVRSTNLEHFAVESFNTAVDMFNLKPQKVSVGNFALCDFTVWKTSIVPAKMKTGKPKINNESSLNLWRCIFDCWTISVQFFTENPFSVKKQCRRLFTTKNASNAFIPCFLICHSPKTFSTQNFSIVCILFEFSGSECPARWLPNDSIGWFLLVVSSCSVAHAKVMLYIVWTCISCGLNLLRNQKSVGRCQTYLEMWCMCCDRKRWTANGHRVSQFFSKT